MTDILVTDSGAETDTLSTQKRALEYYQSIQTILWALVRYQLCISSLKDWLTWVEHQQFKHAGGIFYHLPTFIKQTGLYLNTKFYPQKITLHKGDTHRYRMNSTNLYNVANGQHENFVLEGHAR